MHKDNLLNTIQPQFRSGKNNGSIIFYLFSGISINLFPLVETEVECVMVAVPPKP